MRSKSSFMNAKISSFILKVFIWCFFFIKIVKSSSQMPLTIKGKGNQTVINSDTLYKYKDVDPDKILINGSPQKLTGKVAYNLKGLENNITLVWNSQLTNCQNMFRSLTNIVKVDLSKFDSSKVTNMFCMFVFCSSIVSMNFTNFKTTSAKSIRSMFHGCSSLISLDLSSFDISLVTTTYHMFMDCTSLKFVNLYSFVEKNLTATDDMFAGVPNDLIYCLNGQKAPKIKLALQSLVQTNYSPLNCFENDEEIKIDKNIYNLKCVNNKGQYIYNYNNNCVMLCPAGAYYNEENTECINYIPDGYFLKNEQIRLLGKCHKNCKTCNKEGTNNKNNCLTCDSTKYYDLGNCTSSCVNGPLSETSSKKTCKCSYNVKCKECSIESIIYDLCVSCNQGYYKKYNDDSNINSFINCYKNPNGYYLEENIYKPCYSTCMLCENKGDQNNHNCIECMEGYIFLNESFSKMNCFKKCNFYYFFNVNKTYECTNKKICPKEFNKLIKEKNKCIDNCFNDNIYKYEFNNSCYLKCPNNTISDENYTCKVEQIIDTYLNDNTYIIEQTININSISSTYQKEEVTTISTFEKNNIYQDKPTINIYIINNTYQVEANLNIYNTNNFYQNEQIINSNNYQVEESINIDKDNYKNDKENCTIENLLKNLCIIKASNYSVIDKIIQKINEHLIEGKIDNLIDNIKQDEKDISITINNVIYTITSSKNQKNSKNKNVTVIDLGDCENILKSHYHIQEKDSLLIIKIDIFEKGLLIPTVEYEIFDWKTKEKLDLNLCENQKIKIDIPVSIKEDEIFKYNPFSGFYNDKCYTYTTDKKTDIGLDDRKNEFIEKNMSLCESKCDYDSYNNYSKKVTCECEIKIRLPLISEIVINKDKLWNKFVNYKSFMNLNVMKCWKLLLFKKGLIKNIGNYILLIIILLCIIFLFIFISNDYKKIKKIIILLKNQLKKLEKVHTKASKNNIKKIEVRKKQRAKKCKNQFKRIRKHYKIKNIMTTEGKSTTKKLTKKKLNIDKSKNQSSVKKELLNGKNKKQNNDNKITKNYNDYEINSLRYKLALYIDKRTYSQYFFSLLRQKHLFIFTFCTKNDYNSRIIKIYLFFFVFSLYFSVNSLFFNDSTMHKIYEEEGTFNVMYQIPKSIYSSIICSMINIIVCYLSLTEKSIIYFKRNVKDVEKNYIKLLNSIKIKYTFFFIITFLFLLFFWYYVSCFCAVYNNTQIHLISDALISFGLTLIYPFAFNLLPCAFRIPSLKSKNCECTYRISQILQLI